jgi:hypothetical protein
MESTVDLPFLEGHYYTTLLVYLNVLYVIWRLCKRFDFLLYVVPLLLICGYLADKFKDTVVFYYRFREVVHYLVDGWSWICHAFDGVIRYTADLKNFFPLGKTFQEPATLGMEAIIDLHHDVMFFILIIFIFVFYMAIVITCNFIYFRQWYVKTTPCEVFLIPPNKGIL